MLIALKTTRIHLNKIKRIIKAPTRNYQGVRLGGVGIPGYLFGRFKYLIEDNFETISLYATKLDHLLFIETIDGKRKFYGVTPDKEEDFIKTFNNLHEVTKPEVLANSDAKQVVKYNPKDIKYALSLFILSLLLSVSLTVYFLIVYVQLPQTIPLHFSINFVPNRYGDKIELFVVFLFLIILGIGFASLIYYYIHRRTHLDQTKYGYSIMILPVAINLLFLIITTLILTQTLAFV